MEQYDLAMKDLEDIEVFFGWDYYFGFPENDRAEYDELHNRLLNEQIDEYYKDLSYMDAMLNEVDYVKDSRMAAFRDYNVGRASQYRRITP